MKKTITLILTLFLIIPSFVKSDGIPYPFIRPYISEEHQIVLAEQKGNEIITTLDLGIRNKPDNVFTILEDYVYINENNPVWLKTFLLPENFNPDKLCISSYDFNYYYPPSGKEDISPVEVTINNNIFYLFTKEGLTVYPAAQKEMYIESPYTRTGPTYCKFTTNENMANPNFIDISEFFEPGEYNTIEIRSNIKNRGFSINHVYLQSGESDNKVKIIIPFKGMPESIEIGGQGIPIWELEDVFRERTDWYGYYGGRLLSAEDAPELAGKAMEVEQVTESVLSTTEISADVSGNFEGKVSDLLGTAFAKGVNTKSEYVMIRFADVSYEAYLDYNAYVIELTVEPNELKRVVIRWVETIDDKNDFDYWYPLGTGQTWKENIPYTAIYVKLPENNAIKFSSISGREEATRGDYRYYRWKFVEDNPDKDLYVTVGKLTRVEEWVHGTEVWLEGNKMIIGIIGGLIVIGLIIVVRSKPKRKGL